MALEGTLRDFSLADIFQLIGIQKKTGVLTLKKEGEEVTVSFLNGSVVAADSSRKALEDRLGNVLTKSGRLTELRLQEALRTQKETRQRLGYVLVHGGFIKDQDLREALSLQVTQIVYRLFRWKDGYYHFSQEESVEFDRDNFAPLSAESILMEGIRMIDEWPIIERKIRSFDMVFRKTRPDLKPTLVERGQDDGADLEASLTESQEPAPPAAGLKLAADEAVVYALLDGKRSVQEVIDRGNLGDFETCRVLYDMLSRGHIAETAVGGPVRAASRSSGNLGRALERAGYVALALAVTASLATMGRSPLSGMPRELVPPGALERIQDLVARNRVERLDEAVQVYYLQKRFYPDDLRELAKGRLVSESALKDPWGRGFGFISTQGGYRIIAYDSGGVENPSRSISRENLSRESLTRGAPPAGEPSARYRPR
jgi:hypothetical protein